MKYILYGNGGSGNHGCEAIIRGTNHILRDCTIIASNSIEEDAQYGIEKIASIYTAKSMEHVSKLKWMSAYLKLKLQGNYYEMDCLPYIAPIKEHSKDVKIALAVGGDNYCYNGTEFYGYLNRTYKKSGYKTVLWGCSVEPEVAGQPNIAKDLANYNMIVVRESISYEALKKVNPNTYLCPDPAFYMEPAECELPLIFSTSKVVGINCSPMIISNESSDGVTYKNYLKLCRYILDNTDYSIALIPHVVWPTNDDRTVLSKLHADLGNNKRVDQIEDHKAPELKYIISKCDTFVGARTHATIAAYSTCVPTLVVGYSVKARGIARDLFGKEENYTIPVQSLKDENDLIDAFGFILENKDDIRKHLCDFIPKYKDSESLKQVKQIMESY